MEFLKSHGAGYRIVSDEKDLPGLNFLIVLGGDGTILTLASVCGILGIPIMGVNYGHMGFLAEFERDSLEDALGMLVEGSFNLAERSMLKISYGDKTLYALNDLVMQRSTSGNEFVNTIEISAEIDGSVVDRFASDGLIVSTPTGSTGYSLSAGGSVLSPGIDAFILTPICAHSLHSRPVVYSDKSTLCLYGEDSHTVINLVVDGKILDSSKNFGKITVTKAEASVKFVTPKGGDFFKNLLFKLNKWSK
ncbi:MAG: NAD(+)/NADH kinase [Clostridia bacterium]|nr:NAD(+)/NADH kinase [Clostridia bacterium]